MERSSSPYDRQDVPNFQQAASLTVMLPPEQSATNDIAVVHPIIVSGPEHNPPIGYTAVPMNRIHPSQLGEDLPPPKLDFSAPPPYDLATKLPSYEEVQREKTLQGELPLPPLAAVPAGAHHGHHRQQTLAFLAIDTEGGESDTENRLLGTDYIFCIAFIVAFLFNWIGFLLLMCFCHTVAARYGALSGFGLSLAKWTLIVKHSTELASHENSWLWWLIMTFGILICIRAIFQYLNIKRGWRLLSGSAQERLLFFY